MFPNQILGLSVCPRVSLNSVPSRLNMASFHSTHYLIHISLDIQHGFIPIEADVFSKGVDIHLPQQ